MFAEELNHGLPSRICQKPAPGCTVATGVVVDAAQQQARDGDVDFFRRAEVLLYRNIDYRPHPATEFGVLLVQRNALSYGNVQPVLDHGFAVEINRLLGFLDGFVQRVARAKAAGQIGNHYAKAAISRGRFDGDDEFPLLQSGLLEQLVGNALA